MPKQVLTHDHTHTQTHGRAHRAGTHRLFQHSHTLPTDAPSSHPVVHTTPALSKASVRPELRPRPWGHKGPGPPPLCAMRGPWRATRQCREMIRDRDVGARKGRCFACRMAMPPRLKEGKAEAQTGQGACPRTSSLGSYRFSFPTRRPASPCPPGILLLILRPGPCLSHGASPAALGPPRSQTAISKA